MRPAEKYALNFFTIRKLSRLKKSFDPFTFAADGHAGKFLEPTASGNFGFPAQPVC